MKKFVKKLLTLGLCGALLLGSIGCGTGGGVYVPPEIEGIGNKTAKVKVALAGFGADWLDEVAAKFNETFADEGYKVEITMKDSDIGMYNEVRSPRKNDTDLYFEYDRIETLAKASRSILGADGGMLLEDLTEDVYNQKSIGLDGKEQGTKTIGERLDQTSNAYSRYNGNIKGFDGLYSVPFQGGTTGMFVNKSVLTQKGYTLNDLSTTDGIIKVCNELKPKTDEGLADPNEFFPMSWAAGNAPGYWEYVAHLWFAQYVGKQGFENFWNFIPETGTTVSNGYSVYENPGFYEALKACEMLEDRDFTVPGTSSMDHISAQARVLTGKSMITIAGDWIYKEMETNYPNDNQNVIALRTPVLSAVGVNLGLCGTTHQQGASCANCDAKLKAIIADVDLEVLTDAEIATKLSVAETSVAYVREVRGYYVGDKRSNCACIPSYADAKYVAKLFLRFLYSDEMNDLYRSKTYVSLPIERNSVIDKDDLTENELAVYAKLNSSNSKPVWEYTNSSIRQIVGATFFPQGGDQYRYGKFAYSHSQEGGFKDIAREQTDLQIAHCKDGWSTFITDAGLV